MRERPSLVDRDAETNTPVTNQPHLADRLGDSEPVRCYAGRNGTKATIRVYVIDGAEIALKDYSSQPWWMRQTWGRWLVRRETAAYRAVSQLPGVPQYLGRFGPFAFALRHIASHPLATFDATSVKSAWLDDLESIVTNLHLRGVALGDLHHRDVLIGADDTVHVVDFATAWVISERAGGLRRAVFERFRDADRIALVRMRAKAEGRDPEQAVLDVGGRAARWHSRGRGLKRGLDRLRRR